MRISEFRHAFVTGGASGFGLAIANAMAGHGVRVTLADVDEEALAAVQAERGELFRTSVLDVRDREGWREARARAEVDFGPVDLLSNNAGIGPGYGPFAEVSVADIEVTWAVNLTGPFVCAREAVRHMSTARGGAGGSIVNVSSRAAVIGSPFEWIHYAASKAGLDTLTTGLSKEVAAEGIRVNTVRPGLMTTDFGPWSPPGRTERLKSGVPLGRGGEPHEIAAAIVWLASDDASYVTGAFIDVGGGR